MTRAFNFPYLMIKCVCNKATESKPKNVPDPDPGSYKNLKISLYIFAKPFREPAKKSSFISGPTTKAFTPPRLSGH